MFLTYLKSYLIPWLSSRDDIRKPERPRTALATMRTSGDNNNPEFERRSSGQGGEPGIVHVVTGDQVSHV